MEVNVKRLVLAREYAGALDFLIIVFWVSCGLHIVGQEQATLFRLAVVCKSGVALLNQAFLTFGQ